MNKYYHSGQRVGVLVEAAIGTMLDYKAPEEGVYQGTFVRVPLRNRQVVGVVWGDGQGSIDEKKLRPIRQTINAPVLDYKFLMFIEKLAEYNLAPLSQAFFRLTRTPELNETIPSLKFCEAVKKPLKELTAGRKAVFNYLSQNGRVRVSELLSKANVSSAVVKRLVDQEYLKISFEESQEKPQRFEFQTSKIDFNEEQKNAIKEINKVLDKPNYSAILFKGITGSGKTEVYLEAIAKVLQEGKQVLVLLPEIALTNQIIHRFEQRFKTPPLEWHSNITKAQKIKIWRMIAEGNSKLIVGARSALFLPFKDLGLIIVDEEHDSSYKQDSSVIYHARDMAVLRASLCNAKAILVSATPSLETLVNTRNGKYTRVDLSSRVHGAHLPEIIPIDMRGEKKVPRKWLSSALITEIIQRLERGEQSLLFLNRRGYAPLSTCSECGNQLGCSDCDTKLVEHRFLQEMICHQCGNKTPKPEACPVCQAKDSFVPVGPGVERLAEEVSETFPDACMEVISSDLMRTNQQLMETLDKITRGEVDIIIGTQIIAKGHHFPKMTLVGVLDADVGLHGGDFRATEKTFQIIRQVTGRAGREELPGVAFLQTWQPENQVIQAIVSNDESVFIETEILEREVVGCPPFSQYVAIIISGKNAERLENFANDLHQLSYQLENNQIRVYGPTPAPIYRIQGRLRYRFLLQAERGFNVQRSIRQWLSSVKQPSNIRVSVDVDPIWFM